mmetsp:Transcript_13546/g.26880  ORF Transcript_13546/g.26880 Transcript_13546/m.26880 type:complete len:91 (+) Transcript_13546:584-856(+)
MSGPFWAVSRSREGEAEERRGAEKETWGKGGTQEEGERKGSQQTRRKIKPVESSDNESVKQLVSKSDWKSGWKACHVMSKKLPGGVHQTS